MPLSCENIHATIGDYQRNYLYKVFIENVPAVIAAQFPQALSLQKEIDIYNSKAIFPDRKTNNIRIPWAGEFFDIPGTDNSTREADFEFFDDEPKKLYDFFMACKDLTGNEQNQACVYGVDAKFNMGVAKISVDKETVTAYRQLVGVRVYGLDAMDVDKGGTDILKVKVSIRWDRNKENKAMRGKKI